MDAGWPKDVEGACIVSGKGGAAAKPAASDAAKAKIK